MSENTKSSFVREPIAIVGVSCLMPGSIDVTGFWRNILEGNDLITDVPPTHWLTEDYYDANPKARDKTYANRGAFLPDVDFDPIAWGIPPNIVPATDTCQLLALIVAQRVLDDATRGQFKDLNRERVSVVLGVTGAQELLGSMVARLQKPIWQKSLRDMGLAESQVQDACDRIASHYVEWQESTFPGVLGNVVAGRIANRLDLHGTNCVTDAACASTFSALSMGVNELRLNEADMVVIGGADTMNDIFMYMCFSKTPALSPSGDCRPFSDKADGTMLGEGIGMVALKRLSDAEANGDKVYAVLRGVGTSSDGRAKSVYAPLPEGQARAVKRCYQQAGYGPETVELVEAHGTGTKAGDAAEFDGLRLVFETPENDQSENKATQWCALGSVKSQIGHTKAAAGAAGLVKAVLALHHRTLPPSIKIDNPNPLMKMDSSPFYLATEARPWVRGGDHGRRASVSSFGFGGSNFHLALEEAPTAGNKRSVGRHRTAPTELVIVSADDAAGLASALRKLADEVGDEAGTLTFLARSTQGAYDPKKNARAAVIVKSEAELIEKLRKAADLAESSKAGKSKSAPMVHVGFGAPEGGVAFMFPGQGSQYTFMGADLAMAHDAALAVWDRHAGAKLHDFVFPKPAFGDDAKKAREARLTETQNAQPSIGLTSASMLALLKSVGLEFSMSAGHSYGEISALHAAGAMDEATFLAASQARGASMAEAAEQSGGGTMLAVSATREDVAEIVKGIDVVAANHNHPTQVVLSGSVEAIEEAAAKLEAAKKRATRLPVATAFHSPIVAGAVEPFAKRLETLAITEPKLPVYCNATTTAYEGDPKARIAGAIASPVRFVEEVRSMAEAGARTFVEVGPGSVLTGLIGRILKGEPHRALSMDRKGRHGLTSMQDALGQLVADGRPMQLAALWEEYEVTEDPRTTTKPKLTLKLNGSNYNKPYPPKNGAAGLPKPNPERAPEAVKIVEKVVEKIVEVERVVEKIIEVPVERIVEKIVEVPVHMPAAASSHPAHAAPPNGQSEWLTSFAQAQQQTVDAHRAFQEMMAQSHQSFLQASQASVFGMSMHSPAGAFAQTPAYAAPTAPTLTANNPMPQTLVSYPAPDTYDAPAAPAPVHVPAPVAAAPVAPAPVAPAPVAAAPVAAPVAAAAPIVAPVTPAAASGIDTAMLREVLLKVVSEKTGYPGEMLDLHMDMEADLGIDSIKRVEILSGIKEQVEGLPEVDAAELSKTRTLAEIVGIYEPLLASAGSAPAAPVSSASAAAPASTTPASSGPSIDALRTVLLSVVSEKTGYPPEMLDLNMDMEADLGIDSIKRVEILSGMKEQVDGLPEVDAAELSKTRTLAEIVGIYEPLLGGNAAAPASAPAAPAASGGATIDHLRGVLLNVVAEKTGYPPEMLDMGMDMEADLGIDSIKRVEILSGMKEMIEGLPEVDAAELSKTRTLAEIVGIYEPLLGGNAAGGNAAGGNEAAPASSGGATIDQLQGVLLNVVAEKTGYPPEMLDLNMDMEADLGIDSIKRVEILSGMKEMIEGLPEVDAAELSKTRTLAEIVGIYEPLLEGKLAENLGGNTSGGSAPAGFSEAASAATEEQVGRYVTYLAEAPKAGFALQGLADAKSLLLVPGDGSVAAALKTRLQSTGRSVHIGHELDASTDAVIFLGGLRAIPDVATAREIQREVFRLARDFAKQSAPKFFVSVQDTGGTFGLEGAENLGARAWVGGIPGLIKTAALEWPNVGCRAIDIAIEGRSIVNGRSAIDEQSAGVLAARIDDELHTGGQEVEIALGEGGRRRRPRVRAERVNPTRRPLAPGAVVVASGGARGVTASSLIAFAAASKCRLVLLGRTPLQPEDPALAAAADDASLKRLLMEQARAAGEKFKPADIGSRARRVLAGREIRSTLAAIEAAGGAARYEATDVQDEAKLRETFKIVRRDWGPIAGIVHGAGVLADKRIEDKTDADFDRVFDTKVLGLEALLKACAEDPIQLLCCFSSVAGRAGNVGQCDYAMANEVLNKVTAYEGAARQARGVTMVAKSIGWGPWAGGMVTPALKAHFEAQGVPLIPIEGGAKMFAAEMAAPGDVELVAGASPDAWKGTRAPDESSFDVIVHQRRESFLSSHRVKGEVVVPVVLVLEWFARAAQLHCPDKRVVSCADVKVFQGLVLPDFDTGKSHRFIITAKHGEGSRVALELRDASGRACYRATAHMGAPGQGPKDTPREELTGLAPLQGDVYGDVLFHGSEFQVIRGVDGVGHNGAAATMLGARSMGWPGAESDWQTDPALMDGGLQLALLWASARLGGHSLPTGVESLTLHHRGLPHGPSRVELRAREAEGDKGVCDVVFIDTDGETIAELRGVTTHVLPGTR